MSHHLGVMRQAGLLDDEKDGRRVVYKFRPEIFVSGGNGSEVLGTLTLGLYRLVILRADDVNGPPRVRRRAAARKRVSRSVS
jgi:DNA-binding transcriptional ArsR family regulator